MYSCINCLLCEAIKIVKIIKCDIKFQGRMAHKYTASYLICIIIHYFCIWDGLGFASLLYKKEGNLLRSCLKVLEVFRELHFLQHNNTLENKDIQISSKNKNTPQPDWRQTGVGLIYSGWEFHPKSKTNCISYCSKKKHWMGLTPKYGYLKVNTHTKHTFLE